MIDAAKKGVNGQSFSPLHAFFGIAKRAPRGVILGVAALTERVK